MASLEAALARMGDADYRATRKAAERDAREADLYPPPHADAAMLHVSQRLMQHGAPTEPRP